MDKDSKAKDFSVKERKAIVFECIREHDDFMKVANRYGLKADTVQLWCERFDEFGPSGLADGARKEKAEKSEERKKLEKRNQQLKEEMETWKMKYALLKKEKGLEFELEGKSLSKKKKF